MNIRRASLFINDKNQFIKLPKDFEFERVTEVTIRKEGNSLILSPVRKSWLSFELVEKADADFLQTRADVIGEDGVTQ
jgi:antitoxin VapB